MIEAALSVGGKPRRDVRRLEDGSVVSAVPVEEMHEAHRETTSEQAELGHVAEELGYEYVSVPELHFPLQGTLSPSPLMTLMAIARTTEDIRLMPSVVPDWHDPVRLAERTAMLDVISDGRADIALARGYDTKGGKLFNQHFGQFWSDVPVDSADQLRLFEENFEVLLRAWTEDLLSFDGEFQTIPTGVLRKDESETYYVRRYLEEVSEYEPEDYLTEDQNGYTRKKSMMVAPQPEQDPHPPLWMSVPTERAAQWAARRGMNGIGLTRSFKRLGELVTAYHETAREADWPDRERDGVPFDRGWDADRKRGIAATVSVFNTDVASDDTIERWKRGKAFVVYNVKREYADDPTSIASADAEVAIEEWDSPIYGTTGEIVSELRRLRETCRCEGLLLNVSFDAHGLSTEEKREQMAAFVDDVLPRV